ncbi:hypothetical protein Tco_0702317 [Tanacetum coccineum]|uniref:Uncharacterized protein n=1 Tax=Tanacetum coccineum TaxID=301880 RepID=A0ABQ4XW92_9ASTR
MERNSSRLSPRNHFDERPYIIRLPLKLVSRFLGIGLNHDVDTIGKLGKKAVLVSSLSEAFPSPAFEMSYLKIVQCVLIRIRSVHRRGNTQPRLSFGGGLAEPRSGRIYLSPLLSNPGFIQRKGLPSSSSSSIHITIMLSLGSFTLSAIFLSMASSSAIKLP